jgi:hypothetical protein
MDTEFTFYFLSNGQWLALAAFCAVSLLPATRIMRRAGLNLWWAVLLVVPLINVIALWGLAYCRWPAIEKRTA